MAEVACRAILRKGVGSFDTSLTSQIGGLPVGDQPTARATARRGLCREAKLHGCAASGV